MSKKSYSMDMCNGPILGKMLRFALPLMCSSMLQILFNAADIIVVGKFGTGLAMRLDKRLAVVAVALSRAMQP